MKCFIALLFLSTVLVSVVQGKPNFIVMQPDDLRFFEEWTPPPHYPRRAQIETFPCATDNCLPNIESLRTNGLQMMEAYTASAKCGTSRFSTITGRYPSRSAYSRQINSERDIAQVTIPNTKLEDVNGLNDCSEDNLAALLQQNGYRTGVVGKWHLKRSTGNFDSEAFQDEIRACGFDFVASIYADNLDGNWHDGTFSHNMEYMTAKGIEFIQNDDDSEEPFFLYFNPTAPHSSGDVLEALTTFPCTNTPDGILMDEPIVDGMTKGTTCEKYRQTVIDRANGSTENNDLGAIWVDDAVGALIKALTDSNQLANTFFLFQMDHGQEAKGTLWEGGVRLAQFVHFPDNFPAGSQFHGMVSTVDIGPTILDYAGISESYPMDGKSWRLAVEDSTMASTWDNDRCLFFELGQDRAVRCGCYKYMNLEPGSDTFDRGNQRGLDVDANDRETLYNLCDEDENYELGSNKEATDVKGSEFAMLEELRSFYDCHLDRVKANQDPEYSDCGYSPTPALPTFSCFSGETEVEVKGKGSTKMSVLQLGDQVRVAGGSFESIYSFGHRQDSVVAEYLQLLPTKLELSNDHMIFIRGKGAIPGSMVEIGDILSNGDAISAISTVKRRGVYAPFTASGTLVVNGVEVSSFVSFQGSDSLMVGRWKTPLTWQWLARTFEAPHRVMCRHFVDYCVIESYTPVGISVWVANPLRLTQWLLEQHVMVLSLVLLPLTGALVIVSLLDTILSYPMLALLALTSTMVLLRRSSHHAKFGKL